MYSFQTPFQLEVKNATSVEYCAQLQNSFDLVNHYLWSWKQIIYKVNLSIVLSFYLFIPIKPSLSYINELVVNCVVLREWYNLSSLSLHEWTLITCSLARKDCCFLFRETAMPNLKAHAILSELLVLMLTRITTPDIVNSVLLGADELQEKF